MPEEVSSYKDAGVSYNGKTLTGNDVYTYTNLKDKEPLPGSWHPQTRKDQGKE